MHPLFLNKVVLLPLHISHAVCTIFISLTEFVDDEDYISPTGIFFHGQDLNATNRQRQSTFTQQHWQSRDTVMIVIDARQVEELMQRLRDIERARTTDTENIKRLELYHAMLQPVVTRLEQRQQRQDENIQPKVSTVADLYEKLNYTRLVLGCSLSLAHCIHEMQ